MGSQDFGEGFLVDVFWEGAGELFADVHGVADDFVDVVDMMLAFFLGNVSTWYYHNV